MADVIKMEGVQKLIVELRGRQVLVDADVARIYGVVTRDINKAVGNNSDKFPSGYVVELSKAEKKQLVENFHRFDRLKYSNVMPKAFTEKGLYMLATILKSRQATQTTLMIIETFSKIRELTRTINSLSVVKNEHDKHGLMQRSGELIAEVLDNDLQTTDTETSVEINFAVLKFKHTIKKADKR
jgi:hypothetical protein